MKNIKHIRTRPVQSALVLIVLDIILFGSLNTSRVAQVMLVAGFVLLVANLYMLVYGVTSLIRLYGIPIKRRRRLSIYISLFLGIIIALQSIGELSPRDMLVAVPLALLGYAYISYVGVNNKTNEQNIS